jgi:uncharacterized protein (DUF486 family)
VLILPAAGFAQPTVTLSILDNQAAESDLNTASFSVTRTDDADTTQPLNVFLQRGGSATIGADYTTVNLIGYSGDTYYVQIPANQLSQTVTLTPVRDNVIEAVESVAFTLAAPLSAGHDYTIDAPSQGQMTITDDVTEVTLTVNDATAAEAGQDPASFTVTRSSNGNVAAPLNVFLQRSGSATIGADYSTVNLIGYSGDTYYLQIPANQLSQTVTLTPVLDEIEEGDETVIFTVQGPLSAGHDYTNGIPAQGEMSIRDFVDMIFADSFED